MEQIKMSAFEHRFKSPIVKVAAFFENSRDQWKEKYQTVKAEVRSIKHQIRAIEKSRRQWRDRAEAAEAQLKKSVAVDPA